MVKRILHGIIWIAVIAVLFFLTRRAFFTAGQVELEAFLRFRPTLFLVSAIGFLSAILWWGIVWYLLLPKKERNKISLLKALNIHLYAWLARYIPGKVAMILGKVQAGMQAGLSKRAVIISTGYEQLLQIASGVIVGSLLVGLAWFEVYGSVWGLAAMLGVSIVAILGLHPRIFYPVVNTTLIKLKRDPLDHTSIRSFSVLLKIVGLYSVGQIINGVSFFLLVKAVYPVMNESLFLLAGSYSLAGVIGILALIVPSGLGVREGVITALLSSILPISVAAQLAILARLVSIGVDGILGLILGGRWLSRKKFAVHWLEGIIYSLGAVFLLVLPLIYTGSYIDEYWHIFAGKDLFQTGSLAEIYTTGPYIRGSYVSVLTGIIQALVPGSLYTLKLIPIFVSFGIWVLWWDISRKLVPNNPWFRIVFFILWISSPWLILNHTYIRMYVFYELMLALAIWTTIRLWNVSTWKWYLYAGFLIIGYVGFLYLSFDLGGYMVLLSLLLGLGTTVFFKKDLPINKHWRQAGIILVIIIGMFTPFVQNKIQKLVSLDLKHGADSSYIEFFTQQQGLYLIIFAGAGVLFSLISFPKIRILAGGFLIMIGLHLLLPAEAQLTRSITYLMPVIYFFASLGLVGQLSTKSHLEIFGRTLFVVAFGFLLIVDSYPPNYWEGPYMYGEISYNDYAKAYNYVTNNCQDKPVFESSPTPYLGEFYGIEATPIVTRITWLETDTIFYEFEGEWYVNYNDTQVVTNLDKLPESYCWIRRSGSLANYLTDRSVTGSLTEFVGMEIIEK